jgi:hypothetical protein
MVHTTDNIVMEKWRNTYKAKNGNISNHIQQHNHYKSLSNEYPPYIHTCSLVLAPEDDKVTLKHGTVQHVPKVEGHWRPWLLCKIHRKLRREKLLQIMCVQSHVWNFFKKDKLLQHYTLYILNAKNYSNIVKVTWRWKGYVSRVGLSCVQGETDTTWKRNSE